MVKEQLAVLTWQKHQVGRRWKELLCAYKQEGQRSSSQRFELFLHILESSRLHMSSTMGGCQIKTVFSLSCSSSLMSEMTASPSHSRGCSVARSVCLNAASLNEMMTGSSSDAILRKRSDGRGEEGCASERDVHGEAVRKNCARDLACSLPSAHHNVLRGSGKRACTRYEDSISGHRKLSEIKTEGFEGGV